MSTVYVTMIIDPWNILVCKGSLDYIQTSERSSHEV